MYAQQTQKGAAAAHCAGAGPRGLDEQVPALTAAAAANQQRGRCRHEAGGVSR
jgi:hypothetical protein